MSLSKEEYKQLLFRLLSSRLRLLDKHPFFGLLLMHLELGIDEECDTAYTDGLRIFFGKKFLYELENSEVDFIMMHEIMHVVLKHCARTGDFDNTIFNIACDIVVNSNILYANNMDLKSITLKNYGESMHLTIKGHEGYKYTAEEVYDELIQRIKNKTLKIAGSGAGEDKGSSGARGGSGSKNGKIEKGGTLVVTSIDKHDKWRKLTPEEEATLDKTIKDTYESIRIKEGGNTAGSVPYGLKRMIDELDDAKVDWRTILHDFLSTDKNDYSFLPPDRRIESDFFLPDLSIPEDKINVKIIFNVDTSGSISDSDLTKAFSEINGCIDATNGGLEGYVICSDSALYEPIPFEDFSDIDFSKVRGGGGTDFNALFSRFDEVVEKIGGLPDYIVILTDGYAAFPRESSARGIPVLWIINNKVVTPPWGLVARM